MFLFLCETDYSGLVDLVMDSLMEHLLLLLFISIFYTIISKLVLRHGGHSK